MPGIKWELKQIPIESIKAHPRNPRILTEHEHQHLKQSLDRFGLIDKPIVNTDMTCIGGHQRINILQEDGVTVVSCWVPNRELESEEVDELLIRCNRNTGEWEWETLGNEWEMENLLDWGFTDKDLGIHTADTKEEQQKLGSLTLKLPADDLQELKDKLDELAPIDAEATTSQLRAMAILKLVNATDSKD